MSDKLAWVDKNLEELREKGLMANIRTIQSPVGAKVQIDGKTYLNFCSNNYLGLASDQRLRDAAKKAIDQYGIGPAAVRSIAGTTSLHTELEEKLADFKGVESVVTFQSGFTANLAAIPALVGKDDVIFSDELNHASIIDGCRLSGAEVVRYLHSDSGDLDLKLSAYKGQGKKLLITDGVFSMDGDIAPLDKIYEVSDKHGAMLMVDDAHGEGVLGKGGRGIVDHFGLHNKVDIEVGTMSKAFGVVGGVVAGKRNLIDWIRQRGRPFLFSSAMTIPDVGACIEAVNILCTDTELVDKLWENTKYFKNSIKSLGFNIGRSETPITPIMLGDEKLAQAFAKELFENGLFAVAIVYPTVALGKARVRVMSSASHDKDALDEAIQIFDLVGKKLEVIK